MKLLSSSTAMSSHYVAWRAWWALTLGCVAFAAAATICGRPARLQTQSLSVLKEELERTSRQRQSQVLAISRDFLGELSRAVGSRIVVDSFQNSAHETGVAVASLSLRETPARADQLGRLELTVTAQGSYPALKQVLAEWLQRFPSATVRSQQWRRTEPSGVPNAGSAALEANWVLCPSGHALWAPRLT